MSRRFLPIFKKRKWGDVRRTEGSGALKFFFGDGLTWDDVLDWRDLLILLLSRLPLAPFEYDVPQGREAITPQTKFCIGKSTEHLNDCFPNFVQLFWL